MKDNQTPQPNSQLSSETISSIQDPFPKAEEFIVGIGASAGGLEAIHTLFDNTPNDGAAYVIIQHLSPTHKSMLPELLEKHSKLKIFEAKHEMEVITNCVYVIPEGKTMTISDGKLLLQARIANSPNMSIDIFLNSLALDQENKSVAIILAGMGNDGTRGAASIKKVGGMVIVQDPDSSKFRSMPENVIASGYFDLILKPKYIPLQITKYIKQRTLITENDESSILEIIQLINEVTPLDFSQYKRPTIVRRISKRMIAMDMESIESYIELLHSDHGEVKKLSKEFLISVSRFFRDPEAFEIIQNQVIPEIVKNKLSADNLKVWVIGCATGEEVYSLGILIQEYLTETNTEMEVKIFASDIDTQALSKASKGWYPEYIAKDISKERLNSFFTEKGNGYQIRENIRKMVIFSDHDIVNQPPYAKIDLISCRNMLIYLNSNLQQKIFSTLHYCLNLNGFLFLGPSEGIGELKGLFREVDKKWKVFQNIEGNYKFGPNTFSPKRIELKEFNFRSKNKLKTSGKLIPESLSEIIRQSHFEESGFDAGICIHQDKQIIVPFGNYESILLPKLFTNDIIELLPNELRIAVVTAIKKANSSKKRVCLNQVRFLDNNNLRSVSIVVKPFLMANNSEMMINIVYFKEEKETKNQLGIVEEFDKAIHTNKYLEELELEIKEIKNKLLIAELSIEGADDDIQSYTEELISGNEEMQSANEELLSINEELNMVNLDHQTKIKALAELNDDFNNFFISSLNAQIFVDNDLIIRKFTPVVVKQVNIRDSDVGRSLSDLTTKIKGEDLMEDIKSVISSNMGLEKQIETTDGKWYTLAIQPYVKSLDGKTHGAIITFNDITALKKSNEIIEISNRKLVKINEDHDTFIYSVSHDLKAPLNNIEGLMSILKDSIEPEEIIELNDLISQSVSRLKSTIAELANITQFENEIEEATKINLETLFKEIQLSFDKSIANQKPRIRVEFNVKQILFARKNLRSILLNLYSNALKYRSKDRKLEVVIKTETQEDYTVLSVQDNGIGIAEDKIGKLFSKFTRVHALDSNIEGTGIGLFLIKKIVTNAGGWIEVVSELGKGTTFKVFFKN